MAKLRPISLPRLIKNLWMNIFNEWKNKWMKMNVARHKRWSLWRNTSESAVLRISNDCVTNRPTDMTSYRSAYRSARTHFKSFCFPNIFSFSSPFRSFFTQRLHVNLDHYEFWLQNQQILDPDKNLVEQCVQVSRHSSVRDVSKEGASTLKFSLTRCCSMRRVKERFRWTAKSASIPVHQPLELTSWTF